MNSKKYFFPIEPTIYLLAKLMYAKDKLCLPGSLRVDDNNVVYRRGWNRVILDGSFISMVNQMKNTKYISEEEYNKIRSARLAPPNRPIISLFG